jgi:hypothetical protein
MASGMKKKAIATNFSTSVLTQPVKSVNWMLPEMKDVLHVTMTINT